MLAPRNAADRALAYVNRANASTSTNREQRGRVGPVTELFPGSSGSSAPNERPVATFPTHVFPPAIEAYVTQAAAALGVPVCMIAMPLLGLAAAAIGNTARLKVRDLWLERPIFWIGVVGKPGTGKSPALDAARALIDPLQKAAWTEYTDGLKTWEDGGRDGDPPVLESYVTTDATKEALAGLLNASPGVALVRDELVAWIKSFDAYRPGGDRQDWLSLWAGSPLKIDRKTMRPVLVSDPCAVVVGGVQPDLVPDLATDAARMDGFFDRLDLVYPDARTLRWSDAVVDDEVQSRATRLFACLRPPKDDATGFRPDRVLTLSAEAKDAFADWTEQNADIQETAVGLGAGVLAKYPRKLARIALVLHLMRRPFAKDRDVVSSETVEHAIEVVEYLQDHLAKILPLLGAVPTERSSGLTGRISRLLQRRRRSTRANGWMTTSEVSDGLGGHTPAELYSQCLDALVAAGKVEFSTEPTRGRPRAQWRWVTAEIRNKPEKAPDLGGQPTTLRTFPGLFRISAQSQRPGEGAVYLCAECHEPRGDDDRPCSCGAYEGIWAVQISEDQENL